MSNGWKDLYPLQSFILEVRALRSQLELRKRIEANDEPWVVTKSIADYRDGYFTEMKGIHVDWVKRETQELEWRLKKLEEKLGKMEELL